jgi:hypothetical protein
MEEKLKKELFIIYSICNNDLSKKDERKIYDEYINKEYKNSDYKITNIVFFTKEESKVQIINPELIQTLYEKPLEKPNGPNSQFDGCELILS